MLLYIDYAVEELHISFSCQTKNLILKQIPFTEITVYCILFKSVVSLTEPVALDFFFFLLNANRATCLYSMGVYAHII